MRKIVFLVLTALFFVGCSYNQPQKQEPTEAYKVEKNQILHFVGDGNLAIELSTSDNWESAEMVDNLDKVYYLKRAPSGSGIYLANKNGASIHFKGKEGVVEFKKGKSIRIELVE